MKTRDKYLRYVDIYFKYFISTGNGLNPGDNIPLSSVDFDNQAGEVGDGTINLANHITFIRDELSRPTTNYLYTMERLVDCAQEYYDGIGGSPISFCRYPGFFVRDDLNVSMGPRFSLDIISSPVYNSLNASSTEDPCFSPFISQDQVWNLMLPMFYTDCVTYLKEKLSHILDHIIGNKHTIYNPYLSEILHYHTYLPSMNEKRVKPWERIKDREKHFKLKVKVKRGANNWYFAYGFRAVYNAINPDKKVSTFWYKLWYIPFIWLADRVYHPYICKWFKFKVKRTSYYSMGLFAWYNNHFEDRYVKQFNKAIKKGELFEPSILPYISKDKQKLINMEALGQYLKNYPEPSTKGKMESPIHFLIMYKFFMQQ